MMSKMEDPCSLLSNGKILSRLHENMLRYISYCAVIPLTQFWEVSYCSWMQGGHRCWKIPHCHHHKQGGATTAELTPSHRIRWMTEASFQPQGGCSPDHRRHCYHDGWHQSNARQHHSNDILHHTNHRQHCSPPNGSFHCSNDGQQSSYSRWQISNDGWKNYSPQCCVPCGMRITSNGTDTVLPQKPSSDTNGVQVSPDRCRRKWYGASLGGKLCNISKT